MQLETETSQDIKSGYLAIKEINEMRKHISMKVIVLQTLLKSVKI